MKISSMLPALFVSVSIFWALAGCGASAQPLDRPILYFTITELEGKQSAVSKAITADGRAQELPNLAASAVWSPDGKWIAEVYPQKIDRLSPTGDRSTIATVEGDWEFLRPPTWAPDSQRIAAILASAGQSEVRLELGIVDVQNMQVVNRFPLSRSVAASPVFTYPTQFRWSPKGDKILIVWQSSIVVDMRSGEVETISDEPVAAEWTPDSRGIYSLSNAKPPSTEPAALRIKRLGSEAAADSVEAQPLPGLEWNGWTSSGALLALSPDGSRLAVVGGVDEGSVVRVYNISKNGALGSMDAARQLTTSDWITALDWSPRSDGLVFMTVSAKPTGGDYTDYSLDLALWDLESPQPKALQSVPLGQYGFYLSHKLALMRLLNFKLLSWSH